jgi:hypothetical protein
MVLLFQRSGFRGPGDVGGDAGPIRAADGEAAHEGAGDIRTDDGTRLGALVCSSAGLHLRKLRTRPPRRREAELMGWKRDVEDLGMFLAAVLIVFMMFMGCGIQLDPARILPAPDRADEAVAIVLKSYLSKGHGMPPITWYSPDDTESCAGVTAPDGSCVYGWEINGWWFDSGHIVVTVYPDLTKTWQVLAHEIAHWRFGVDGHPVWTFGDFDHTGVDGGPVGAADAELLGAGL